MEGALRLSVPVGTQLIETFLWHPVDGFRHLDRHLARMERSAAVLGFAYDEARALYEMQVSGENPQRCRLTLGEEGFGFETADFVPVKKPWVVTLSEERLQSGEALLGHKTSQRAIYDAARAAMPKGSDEVLLLNERGEVCEGSITNVFVTYEDGSVVTPPLSCGLLPGILREQLLEDGSVREGLVTPDALKAARALHVGNSLRGLIKAELKDV
jgi:4-amino-4-deoxychorismate lyase